MRKLHWAVQRLLDPSTGAIDSKLFGVVAGEPPLGFLCEPCHPGMFPDYPDKKAAPATFARIQAERAALGPLYRHCPKCKRVTVHFPMPGKKP